MLIRPDRDDLRIIGFYLSKVVLGLVAVMAPPLVLALVRGNVNDITALVVGIAIAVLVGAVGNWRLRTDRPLEWSHALVTVASAWALATALLSVPTLLAGHHASYLDAYFDMMSGLTTSGLGLVQDLDHLSPAMNLLRHITHFAGGQGIVVVVLTMLGSAGGQVATLYVGEAREDHIVPSIIRTARFIWLVALVWGVVGTAALWVTGMVAGLSPGRSLFHAVNLFMATFDTGGFAPNSSNVAYYHSASMEVVMMVLMVAGTLSFALHHELWQGRWRPALRHIETRTLLATVTITGAVVVFGLARAGTYTDLVALFRKGIFTTISAHSGTGFAVNASALYITDWGLIAPAGVVVAMALGGMASSTAGGMKAIRIGLVVKSVARDIRRAIQPDAARVTTTYMTLQRRVLRDDVVRAAVTILMLYLLTYVIGGVVGTFYGHPLTAAMFESTSAAANVGLSSGVLSPSNPAPLKLTYIIQMWVGRLEFMSVFALVGWGAAVVRGRL